MAEELSEQELLEAELRGACRGWWGSTSLVPFAAVENAFIAGYHYALDQQKSPGTRKE